MLQNSKLRYPQPPWNHPLQPEDSTVQAKDRLTVKQATDTQKHEGTICSKQNEPNISGEALTFFYLLSFL